MFKAWLWLCLTAFSGFDLEWAVGQGQATRAGAGKRHLPSIPFLSDEICVQSYRLLRKCLRLGFGFASLLSRKTTLEWPVGHGQATRAGVD